MNEVRINIHHEGNDVIGLLICPKCKVEFRALLSAGGNEYCERCHIQTLYDRVKKLEKRNVRRIND